MIQESAGGGGFGAPRDRPAEAVRADLEAEYVSSAEAERLYGVVVVKSAAGLVVERRSG